MVHLVLPVLAALLLGLAGPSAFAFELLGHRGARGLAPENTLAAFERALRVGVDTLEMDVHLSADGLLVVAHDPALNPDLTRDEQGRWLVGPGPLLRSLTLAQIQSHDVGRLRPDSAYARNFPAQQPADGERIPTLAQVFQRTRELGGDAVRFSIEIKLNPNRPDDTPRFEAIVDALLATVREADVESRVAVQGFDWRPLQRLQRLAPQIPTVYLSVQQRMNNIADGRRTAGFLLDDHGTMPKLVKAAGGSIWSPHFGDLSAALVDEAHALGLKVVPWTVNEPADMDRLIGWGVDGLISDRPDLVREVMAARGLPLPRRLRGRSAAPASRRRCRLAAATGSNAGSVPASASASRGGRAGT